MSPETTPSDASRNGCIVITGGAGALGSAVARFLVKNSENRISLIDSERSRSRAEDLARELGQGAASFIVDAGSSDAWQAQISAIERKMGPISGAVLVAGTWQGGAPLHERKDDAIYRTMIETNLNTAYASLRALLPGMVARKSGSIVVVGSRVVERPWASTGASEYAASKAAVVALAQASAQEVLAQGVRINAVLPSTMDTPANRASMPKANPADWVSTESCANVIGFLLSPAARDISGAAIPVYGRA